MAVIELQPDQVVSESQVAVDHLSFKVEEGGGRWVPRAERSWQNYLLADAAQLGSRRTRNRHDQWPCLS